MIFTLRLLHIFTVNKQLGPKIVIVSKMGRGGVALVWAGPEDERGGAKKLSWIRCNWASGVEEGLRVLGRG